MKLSILYEANCPACQGTGQVADGVAQPQQQAAPQAAPQAAQQQTIQPVSPQQAQQKGWKQYMDPRMWQEGHGHRDWKAIIRQQAKSRGEPVEYRGGGAVALPTGEIIKGKIVSAEEMKGKYYREPGHGRSGRVKYRGEVYHGHPSSHLPRNRMPRGERPTPDKVYTFHSKWDSKWGSRIVVKGPNEV